MYIISHRGLNPSLNNFFAESSYESFEYFLQKGFGVEFDINFTKDYKIIIFHDASLERITKGKDKRLIREITFAEIMNLPLGNCKFIDFESLIELILKYQPGISALHLKGRFQRKEYLVTVLKYINQFKNFGKNIIIFDVKPGTAKFLKGNNSSLILAPSIAHGYDIKRYNKYVDQTLISINQAVMHNNLFDWVWMDEWDRKDESDALKEYYIKENFELLRKCKFKIGLVTPELHSRSAGILAGEKHQDAANDRILFTRIRRIIKLKPDLICTDYPEKVKKIYEN